MKKVILVLLVVMAHVLNAVEYKVPAQPPKQTAVPSSIDMPYARDYVLLAKGIWNNEVENLTKNDPLFIEGNKMLNDPKYFIVKTMPVSTDPEFGDKSLAQKNVADIENAIKKLVQSAKTYQNPVAAYEALQLSIKFFGKGPHSPISKDMTIIGKLLFNYEVCDGYLFYGEQLERSGNTSSAYDVYMKGYNNQKCTGWYQAVMGGKLSVLKKNISK